jgi:SAM-dependent methyltransferase
VKETREERAVTDYRSLAYARYQESAQPDYARFATAYRRRVGKRISVGAGWKCLDVACGYGNFLAFLRSAGVSEYFGIDTSESALRCAAREFGEHRFAREDAMAFLRRSSTSFDLISALDFVEHLTKTEFFDFLRSSAVAQAPGGQLLLRTPNANSPFGMAARYNDITHELCFTPNSISDALSRCGYLVLQIWEDRPEPGSIRQTVHWGAWHICRFIMRCADAAETGSWGDGVLTRNMWVLATRE